MLRYMHKRRVAKSATAFWSDGKPSFQATICRAYSGPGLEVCSDRSAE